MSQDLDTIRPKGSASPGVFESYQTGGRYMARASSASFNIGSPSKFTVRMWFRAVFNNNNNGLATRSNLSSSQGDWAVILGNGTTMFPTFRLNNNGVSLQSANALTVGTWYFIECSYDSSLGSNNLKMFINGVLDCQATYNTVISNNAVAINVGTYFTNGFCMLGHISEFEFSNGVVRNTANYTPPTTITPDANTTILWKFTKGAVTTDSSGNGFTGTVSGTGVYADTVTR